MSHTSPNQAHTTPAHGANSPSQYHCIMDHVKKLLSREPVITVHTVYMAMKTMPIEKIIAALEYASAHDVNIIWLSQPTFKLSPHFSRCIKMAPVEKEGVAS